MKLIAAKRFRINLKLMFQRGVQIHTSSGEILLKKPNKTESLDRL